MVILFSVEEGELTLFPTNDLNQTQTPGDAQIDRSNVNGKKRKMAAVSIYKISFFSV